MRKNDDRHLALYRLSQKFHRGFNACWQKRPCPLSNTNPLLDRLSTSSSACVSNTQKKLHHFEGAVFERST
ncbi:hypothetical protein [Altericista sp. CCNU0014]|uniref:hypothetical protein n=1 Tax=Altericista sp. CCNU0014 TaxID=3082949 RepID=UPI00384DBB17